MLWSACTRCVKLNNCLCAFVKLHYQKTVASWARSFKNGLSSSCNMCEWLPCLTVYRPFMYREITEGKMAQWWKATWYNQNIVHGWGYTTVAIQNYSSEVELFKPTSYSDVKGRYSWRMARFLKLFSPLGNVMVMMWKNEPGIKPTQCQALQKLWQNTSEFNKRDYDVKCTLDLLVYLCLVFRFVCV